MGKILVIDDDEAGRHGTVLVPWVCHPNTVNNPNHKMRDVATARPLPGRLDHARDRKSLLDKSIRRGQHTRRIITSYRRIQHELPQRFTKRNYALRGVIHACAIGEICGIANAGWRCKIAATTADCVLWNPVGPE